ncbi:MAG: MarR family EPS-associated transcriptional regulator [Arcobacteraceae bacterium]
MQHDELTLNILKNIETTSSQKSLAKELEISVGKVNYILKSLVEKGLIKAENFFANKNKNQYKYLLTKKGFHEKITLTQNFIDKKKKEYDELQKELQLYTNQMKEKI